MELRSESFTPGGKIPGQFAFCLPHAESHVCLGGNLNPHLAWDGVPPEATSLVLICHDPDVPSVGDDVNQPGREVPANLPRVDFFHWILVDIPPQRREIAAGEFSRGVTPRGKGGPSAPGGLRQGINDYTGWFAGDADMRGDYFGYDGPCPPWNDALRHRYIFTLYATDLPRLPLEGGFQGAAVRAALAGHILAEASILGTYSLNPSVRD